MSVVVRSQEGKNPYRKVSKEMNTFMKEICKKAIAELTDGEFSTLKEARIKSFLAEDTHLKDEVSRNWAEIKNHDYIFDRRMLCAEDMRSITKSDLQDFFDSFTQTENMRKFGIYVIGNLPESGNSTVEERELKLEIIHEKLNDDETVINDIEEFRRDLYLHPVVREVVKQ